MVECEFTGTKELYKKGYVLIDTWWNVNKYSGDQPSPATSFNRYMVECESIYKSSLVEPFAGFNRYMVECEYNIS